jgi:Protein of unknown function (DUF3047)
MTSEEFRAEWSALLDSAARDEIRESRFVHVFANRPPWTATGMELARGEQVTIFCAGRVWLAANSATWQGSHFALWFRIGGRAPIFRASRRSRTFVAQAAGELEMANIFPTMWADESGAVAATDELFQRAAGGFDVLVIRWRNDAKAGLGQLARGSSPMARVAAGELASVRQPQQPPTGWKHLWVVGESDVFSEIEPGVIRCDVADEAAIVQKPLAAPFSPGTHLGWSWKIDSLPTTGDESSLSNHDYLSIAAEFDNGRDLTYFWSAALAPETSFHCPVSMWRGRETHMVVRTGTSDLGRWINEKRNLWNDYAKAIGGPPPARIVAVWLIAVSNFRHGHARCEYRDLELIDGSGTRIPVTARPE